MPRFLAEMDWKAVAEWGDIAGIVIVIVVVVAAAIAMGSPSYPEARWERAVLPLLLRDESDIKDSDKSKKRRQKTNK